MVDVSPEQLVSPPDATSVAPGSHQPASAATDGRRFRIAFAFLLVASAVGYSWNVGAAGYANPFYAAAAQAATRSPVAWLFGAVDAPGFITVDKPPVAFWWMGLWARVFGFSSWSLLLPQAALGVATVALLVLTARRWCGDCVALAAGLIFALTPVTVIMFRYDEPDPMLAFLLVAAAWALVRSVDTAPRRAGYGWLALCGALVGLGFLTKMGMALFVLPAYTLTYLVAAPVSWRRRIGQLTGGLAGLVVGAGWFMTLVWLWPAAARPWIGGSTNNSLWQLAVGYNGLSRLLGRHSSVASAVTGPPGGLASPHRVGPDMSGMLHRAGGFGGGRATPGPLRLFDSQFAGQISWLLPVALLSLVALLWVGRRSGRTDRGRAAALLWGAWLLVALLVLSFMRDMVNTYYPLVMAPPLAVLVAMGAETAWRRRASALVRALVTVAVVGTAGWAWRVLGLTPTFVPWLRWAVLAAALVAVAVLWVPSGVVGGGPRGSPGHGRLPVVAVVAVALAGLAGPAAYALDTIVTPHAGLQVAAGPRTAFWRAGHDRTGTPGFAAARTSEGGQRAGGRPGWDRPPDPALVTLLRTAGTTWSAAVPSTMAAASLELSSDTSVIGIGGFTGSDPTPTLTRFQQDVAAGRVHYLITGDTGGQGPWAHGTGADRGRMMRGGRMSTAAPILAWARSRFASMTVGGQTVYDLTKPASAR
jgi:4-amino-4-deoxy-L-arabinose transferase-like glycosyltransferase